MLPKPLLLVLLALLFCLPLHSSAQQNFVPGYFVTTQNDTIRCLINDKNWQKNPKEIQYKITAAGEVSFFKPAQIKSFGLTSGDVYVGEIVTMETSSKDVERLKAGTAMGAARDTVFLRVLVRGAADLLYLYNGHRDYFYYQANGESPKELVITYSLQKTTVTGKTMLMQDSRYLEQLKSYLGKCTQTLGNLSEVKYTTSDLKMAFKRYNTCQKNNSYASQEEKPMYRFGYLGGASLSKLKMESAERSELSLTNFKSPLQPVFGMAFKMVQPRNNQRWAFSTDVGYTAYSAEGHHTENSAFTYTHKTYHTKFDVENLGVGAMVHYQFKRGTSRPYVGVGVANNFILNVKEYQSLRVTYDFSNREGFYERQPLGSKGGHAVAGLLAVGVESRNMSLELRGESGNGFTENTIASTTRNAVSLLLRYYFTTR